MCNESYDENLLDDIVQVGEFKIKNKYLINNNKS